MLTALYERLRTRLVAAGRERGETPMAVMIGLAVFALLALSAGPILTAFTAQSAASSNDRRADKALAVLLDSARREPWATLELGGPEVERVTLAGYDADVATWVQVDPDSASRRLITVAVAEHGSDLDCVSAPNPSALPADCVVRTAVASATATDVRPDTSPNVTVQAVDVDTPDGTTVAAGADVFTVQVDEPMRVAVVARTSADATLRLVSTGIERATVTLKTSEAGSDWRFGNAVVCPDWSNGGTSVARLSAPANVDIADLLVLTTPAPGTCGQTEVLPAFTTLPLVNGWLDYGTGWATARYTKSRADVVVLSGLIRSGVTTGGTTIAQLPPGSRPSAELIFQQASNGTATSRVDVLPDGRVVMIAAAPSASGWVSLDGISFVASGSTKMTFTTLPLSNGWTHYGAQYGNVQAARDSYGRVHLQGLANNGALGDNTVIATLPESLRPDTYLHFASGSTSTYSTMGVSAAAVVAKASTTSWLTTNALFYAADAPGSWTTPALQSGWVKHPSASYPTLSYRKAPDGLVTVRGLISGGTVTSGTVIATLPAGFRPSAAQVRTVASGDSFARVDIAANGDIIAREGVNAAWLSVEFTFVAER